jgi:hypothetical protein
MRAGTANPSGPPEFTPGFCRVSVARSHLVIILSVLLRFAVSDYPFGIFKIFLCFSFLLILSLFISNFLMILRIL